MDGEVWQRTGFEAGEPAGTLGRFALMSLQSVGCGPQGVPNPLPVMLRRYVTSVPFSGGRVCNKSLKPFLFIAQ